MLSKYLASPQDIERLTVEAMQKADADPAHIYAYKKTGYLMAESFVDRATEAALQEWDAAIDEFDAYGGEPPLPSDVMEFDELIGQLHEDIESLIYLIGLASDKFFNTDLLPTSSGPSPLLSPEQYQSLCAVRVHRTLRSIRMLLHERMSDDVIKLVRSIYESYLHMSMVCHDPAKVYDLVDVIIGLRSGTHQYKKKKDGSDNKRIIVDIKTGQEYLGQISAYRMAESSGMSEDLHFFDFFYRRTSEFLHPSVFALDGYISEHGFDAVKTHMYEEAVVFTACTASMVADRIRFITGCPHQLQIDCLTIVGRVRSRLLRLLELLDVWQQKLGANIDEIRLLQARCRLLAEG